MNAKFSCIAESLCFRILAELIGVRFFLLKVSDKSFEMVRSGHTPAILEFASQAVIPFCTWVFFLLNGWT